MSEDLRVGIDIGGTFTDLVLSRNGTQVTVKTPSVPSAPERGVLKGLTKLQSVTGFDPEQIQFIAHGTTVGTNAVLERSWGETALVTTDGFRDVPEIGRQSRPALYDFQAEKPTPIVERDRRFEVPERMDQRGNIIEPLDESAVREVGEAIRDLSVDSVAISFLFSFENPYHEQRAHELLGAQLDVPFSLSSRVSPEIKEYERTLTTTINAALKPVMEQYLHDLERGVSEMGVSTGVKVMQSNGGIITTAMARERPVNTVLSGPAAGAKGAAYVAKQTGLDDILTIDMGGTSCDVSLVRNGEPVMATDVTVGEYPINVPMIDVHTIGAGGGSIAWLDTGDALRVGPRSAGAEPGPVCYGHGGEEPTVTDAQYVLGRIDPTRFDTGTETSLEKVREVIDDTIATPMGIAVETAAHGIVDVANANMERALRVVSVERGHDPREFGLVAFGGAGPLHATDLADKLDIPRVLIPRSAGVLSALGLLVSDIVIDFSASRVRKWEAVTADALLDEFRELRSRGSERLAEEGVDESAREYVRSVDLRYAGQSFELSIPVPRGEFPTGGLEAIADRFHDTHRERYGYATPDEPLELVTIRLRVIGRVDDPLIDRDRIPPTDFESARREYREVVFDDGAAETPVYEWKELPSGNELRGPAIVEGSESTIVLDRHQVLRVDALGNVAIRV